MLRPGEELIVMRTTHWSGGRGDSLVEATMAEILYDLRIRGMLVQRRNTTETRWGGGRICDGGHFRFGDINRMESRMLNRMEEWERRTTELETWTI